MATPSVAALSQLLGFLASSECIGYIQHERLEPSRLLHPLPIVLHYMYIKTPVAAHQFLRDISGLPIIIYLRMKIL